MISIGGAIVILVIAGVCIWYQYSVEGIGR